MNCPRCRKPMIVLELDRVEIDYCLACKGVWLDSGELEILLGGTHSKNLTLASQSGEKKIRCPKCAKKMSQLRIGDPHAMFIDSCPDNHGFWLDGGELAELLKKESHDNRIFNLLQGIFGKEQNKEGE